MNHTTHQEGVKKLAELIKDIDIAMLTTVDEDGTLRSRPMSTQEVEFDGDLWFLTSDDTAKVGEISRENRVNVSYAKLDKPKLSMTRPRSKSCGRRSTRPTSPRGWMIRRCAY